MSPLVETAANIVTQFAFWSAVAFMLGYTVMAKWWKSDIGWARISMDFGIALALAPSVAHFIFGLRVANSVTFAWYAICAIAFVGCVPLWNLALVVREQLRAYRHGR